MEEVTSVLRLMILLLRWKVLCVKINDVVAKMEKVTECVKMYDVDMKMENAEL